MRIEVNGARIFFDVEGAKLVPEGTTMREKPTLLLLHGGPGFDHSGFKPEFSSFADMAAFLIGEVMSLIQNDKIGTDLIALAKGVKELIAVDLRRADDERCTGIFFAIAGQDADVFGTKF